MGPDDPKLFLGIKGDRRYEIWQGAGNHSGCNIGSRSVIECIWAIGDCVRSWDWCNLVSGPRCGSE